ncbi:MAG: GAF domain-containing protein [Longimicrobiales bacterium]
MIPDVVTGGASSLGDATAEELADHVAKQESLRGFIESISSELQLRPLLTLILRHACELIGADNGTIGLYDEARGVVRTEAVYRMPSGELGAEMSPGIGLAGQVLLRQGPVVMERYGDVPNPTQPSFVENAVIGMPISWHGRLIGFFGIGSSPRRGGEDREPDRRSFTDEDVATLGVFARHAAIAIDNARRYAWEQQRTERLKLIARIGQIITADLRLDELLASAADAIHELLGYPNVAIPLILPDDPETLVLNTVGGHYRAIVKGEYRIPVQQGIMGAAARERRAVLVNDVASDPRHIPTPGATGIRAELAVPILLGERVLGVLNVESGDPLTDEDAASLQIIADQLAVAIENARLYRRGQQLAVVEERHRLARDLHDSVTQHMFGMVMIAESLVRAFSRSAAEGERRVNRLLELSRTALAEMRALLAELRPAGAPLPVSALGVVAGVVRVRRDGLVAALEEHIARTSMDELPIALEAADYAAQRPALEEELYRIAQEALNNVLKHACARRVMIRLVSRGGVVRLNVQDDGIGFDPASVRSGGLGLTSMRERAEQLSGTIAIDTVPGAGTLLEVSVPIMEATA